MSAMPGVMVLTAAALLLAFACCGALGQSRGGLSEEEMEQILDAHNYYRRIVDPVATNMLKMVTPIIKPFSNGGYAILTGVG